MNIKQVNYEIIVFDNCSSDGDVEEITYKFKDIVLIKNLENIGYAKANNIGVKHARGKYVLILNNDTLFIENSVKKVFDFCESINEKILVGCRLLNIDHSIQNSTYKFPAPLNIFSSNFFLYKIFPNAKYFNKAHISKVKSMIPVETDVVIGAFIFLETKYFLEMNGFDERFFFYHEDSDLCKRFKDSKGKVIYFPVTSIIHLGGATVNKYLWFHYMNRSIALIKLLQKHYKKGSFLLSIIFHYTGIFIRIPIFLFGGVIQADKNLLKRSYYFLKLLFIYPKNEF